MSSTTSPARTAHDPRALVGQWVRVDRDGGRPPHLGVLTRASADPDHPGLWHWGGRTKYAGKRQWAVQGILTTPGLLSVPVATLWAAAGRARRTPWSPGAHAARQTAKDPRGEHPGAGPRRYSTDDRFRLEIRRARRDAWGPVREVDMTKSGASGPKARARARQKRDDLTYTQALRGAAAGTASELEDRFGGHEFEYEQHTDLFRCTECRVYEVVARDTDGSIAPCPGLVGYGGDTERVYLLLTENPAVPYSLVAFLATSVRSTGIGRAPRFSWRDGRLLVESAPSVVDELVRRIERITTAVDGRPVPAVSSVEHLTAEAGRAVIAQNRAAYVAEYGEPA